MDNELTLSQFLKRQRHLRGWTQAQLAREAFCATVTIKRIEQGTMVPSVQLAQALAAALALPAARMADFTMFAREAGATRDPDALYAAPVLPVAKTTRRYVIREVEAACIGRDDDIEAVCRVLGEPATRLLTLLGPPGVGKTRLAQASAARVQAGFNAGACFVSLAPATDEAGFWQALGLALGLRHDAVLATLCDLQVLLVLDNFEQLLGVAPALKALLESCPDVTALVTSREPLRILGEREFQVSPLAIDMTGASPAIALFVKRACAVSPAFALTAENTGDVHELCRWLGGLPLAIEMAAARMRVLSPDTALDQLRQSARPLDSAVVASTRFADPRHRTMRDAILWSVGLLDAAAGRAFAALGVFADVFDLAGAQAVGVGSDLVIVLADAGLLQMVEHALSQFRMLPLVRELAREHLHALRDAGEIGDRHADWVLGQLRESRDALTGTRDGDARFARLQVVRRVEPDVERALHHVLAKDAWRQLVEMTGLMVETSVWVNFRGSARVLAWFERVSNLQAKLGDDAVLGAHCARVMRTYCIELGRRGELNAARQVSASSVGWYAAHGSPVEHAKAMRAHALVMWICGRAEAGAALAAARARWDELGRPPDAWLTWVNSASFALQFQDDPAAAVAFAETGVALALNAQEPLGPLLARSVLAGALTRGGAYDAAEAQFALCMAGGVIEQASFEASVLYGYLAELAFLRADMPACTTLLRKSLQVCHRQTWWETYFKALSLWGAVLLERGELRQSAVVLGAAKAGCAQWDRTNDAFFVRLRRTAEIRLREKLGSALEPLLAAGAAIPLADLHASLAMPKDP